MQYSLCIAVQCFTMQYSSVQCNTVQNNAVQFSTVQYSSVQCSKHCEVLSVHGRLDEVPPYSWLVLITSLEDISILGEDTWTLHCPLRHCTVRPCTALHCTALHCTALQCTALHCTALHCTLQSRAFHVNAIHWTVLQKILHTGDTNSLDRIVGPIQFWRGCVIYRSAPKSGLGPRKNADSVHTKVGTRSTRKCWLGSLRSTFPFLGLYSRSRSNFGSHPCF